ncbi:MAG: DNA-processing protein DprA [Dehalococcoidia bacterium]|nr:DNA-processing protein DprA [Dehalococcoidia bacterium]MDW8119584.1 DNA-processing protein DprA [Chloroflexota bacterium]
MEGLAYWVAFARIPLMTPARFRLLEGAFGSLEEAWRADASRLRGAGLEPPVVDAILHARARIDPFQELETLHHWGATALTWHDTAYPRRLKEIRETTDVPPVLFVQGNLQPQDDRALAVVGTRQATPYGLEACRLLTRALVEEGFTIVSGLAQGIDACAHQTALEAGGRTIAVVAGGLDRLYPQQHRFLARRIATQGAVLTEYPLGTRPEPFQFHRRNRILSGLAWGVLVVEAPLESGAMSTVQWALSQGREVFAVPGPITSPASAGTHRLIQEGAKLVTQVQDILEELRLETPAVQPFLLEPSPPASPPSSAVRDEASLVLEALGTEAMHIDDLRRRTGLPMPVVSATLTMLEVSGRVRQVGGMHFVRTDSAR